jgi:hypothetical protein
MVRGLRVVVLILAALSVLTVAVPARAATVEECQATITDLRSDTQNATFTGQNAEKDQTGLVSKLESASVKLGQGKVDDALQALTQFRDKVVTLQSQGKLVDGDLVTVDTLIGEADAALSCVQSLTG